MDTSSQNQAQKKNYNVWQRILCGFLALLLLALSFIGGYFFRYYTEDPASRTLHWIKNMVREYYYQDIPEKTLASATFDELFGYNGMDALLDDYSAYYTPEAFEARLISQSGGQSGIGLSFFTQSGDTKIYRVIGNSPAEESGLKAGMYMLGYGWDEEHVAVYQSSTFSQFVAGLKDGQQFVIQAAKSSEDEGEYYTVQYKSAYTQNYVFYADSSNSYRFTGKDADQLTQGETQLDFLPDDTAYVRLDSFYGDAAEQFEGVLEVFQNRNKKRLVLDLRNNGGGFLSVLCDLAEYLCRNEEGGRFPVTFAQYKGGKQGIYYADESRYDEYFSDDVEISVLVNQNTASASEALLGVMLDYGTIDYEDIFLAQIGDSARSYGKGIMQSTYSNVLTGEAVTLTTATLHWPISNTCIQDRGILPEDGAVAVPSNGYVDYGDAMLRQIVADYFA
ncbi:MAG: hypothetical protein IJY26_04225 [Clostridia bacterium]|nr:hypothetical protein [Clostridia bacterium]